MDVVVGRLGRPHGVHGEISVEVRTDDPDLRFAVGNKLTLDSGKQLSAGSTSVVYGGYLYTVGVFDAKMDRKKLK